MFFHLQKQLLGNFGGPEKDRFVGLLGFVEMELNRRIRRGFGLGA